MNKISFISSAISRRPAFAIFFLIFSLTALNAIFNTLAFAVGYEYPYTTFLLFPSDRFADYFKVIFSYPGAADVNLEGSSALLTHYLHDNPYQGQAGLAGGALTHFHMPPFTTLVSLLNLKLMHFINPKMLFVAIFSIGFILTYKFISDLPGSKLDLFFIFLAILFSYPTLFMVTRGHVFSGISSLALLVFLVFMFQEKRKYFALILLAIAVNLRPNAIIFIFALGLCEPRNLKKDIPIFLGATAAIFLASYFLCNSMYADYTIENFLAALRIYHSMYVVNNGGLEFGSSLFGALKLAFGYNKFFEMAPVVIAALLVLVSTLYFYKNIITKVAFIFLLCAAYVLGSSVIADYHLTIFFAPLLYLYLDRSNAPNSYTSSLDLESLIIFLSSVFVLCPKSYIYFGSVSWQVILNPLVLLLASTYIIVASGLNRPDTFQPKIRTTKRLQINPTS